MAPREAAHAVFAPALYPNTPLEGKWVLLHGTLSQQRGRRDETIIRARDEKGEWEAYAHYSIPLLNTGESVRAYGRIMIQPDGSVQLAAQWIKKIEMEEAEYCLRETHANWEKIIQNHAGLQTLSPAVPKPITTHALPPVAMVATPYAPTPTPPAKEDDFVPASELEVEKEYV